MRIDLRSRKRLMAKHLLYASKVGTVIEHMRSKAVAERMATGRLLKSRFANRVLDGTLDRGRMEMVTVDDARSRIRVARASWS